MFIGLNAMQQRTDIDSAASDENYYCPCCGGLLVQKKGAIKVHHFAHSSNNTFCDGAKGEMSEWHRESQNRFPPNTREIIFELGGIRHISDITVHKIAVEFQHSSISINDFYNRNRFYNATHAVLVWVFDVEEIKHIYWHNGRHNVFTWKWAPKIFEEYDADEPEYCLFLDFGKLYGLKPMLHVKWNRQGMKYFAGDFYSYNEFVQIIYKAATQFKNVNTKGKRICAKEIANEIKEEI